MVNTTNENSSGYVMSALSTVASVITWPFRAFMPSVATVPQAPPLPPLQPNFADQILQIKLRPAANKNVDPHQSLIEEIEHGVILKKVKDLPKIKLEEKPGALTLFQAKQQLKSATLRQLADKKPSNNIKDQMKDVLTAALDRRREVIDPSKEELSDNWDDVPKTPQLSSKRLF